MTLDGKAVTQPFEVVRDPAIPSTDADLAASTKMQLRVRNDQNEAADMVNELEIMRKRLEVQIAEPRAIRRSSRRCRIATRSCSTWSCC